METELSDLTTISLTFMVILPPLNQFVRLRQLPVPVRPIPRVLGVDDWAQRKGRTYGTILVDLETRQVVDLLPDHTAATLANWRQAHPGVINRDKITQTTT